MTEKSKVMIWKAIVSSMIKEIINCNNPQIKKVWKLYLDVRDLHELDAVLLLGGEGVHAVARHPGVNLQRKGF